MHICAEYCELVREAAEFEDPRLAELRERMTRDDLFLLSYVIKRKRKHSRALAAWISARSAREKTAYHEAGTCSRTPSSRHPSCFGDDSSIR
jgi:hypothetical protein